MKSFLVVAFLSICSFSNAEAKALKPQDHSCRDLQELLKENGELELEAKLFGTFFVYANESQCYENETFRFIRIKTADTKRCELGFVCFSSQSNSGG